MSGRLSPAQYNIDGDHDGSDEQYDRNDMFDDPFVVISRFQKTFGVENPVHPACTRGIQKISPHTATDTC